MLYLNRQGEKILFKNYSINLSCLLVVDSPEIVARVFINVLANLKNLVIQELSHREAIHKSVQCIPIFRQCGNYTHYDL